MRSSLTQHPGVSNLASRLHALYPKLAREREREKRGENEREGGEGTREREGIGGRKEKVTFLTVFSGIAGKTPSPAGVG